MAASGEETMSRLDAEIALLEAMYPDQIEWSERAKELKLVAASTGGDMQAHQHATLTMRIPDDYPGPGTGLPTIISATDGHKTDLRQRLGGRIRELDLPDDLEVLDQIVNCFIDLVEESQATIVDSTRDNQSPGQSSKRSNTEKYKTVIIWLHHLLATGKRKLALNPSTNAASPPDRVRGLTKPGYPGVMLFSGSATLVDSHVTELKSQRWQAFQVRFEEEHESATHAWQFAHGSGIAEFESMAEVAQDIVRAEQREAFLKAVGVK